MASKMHSIMLVTANVGSLFEDYFELIAEWLAEFMSIVSQQSPHFLALHLQEFGGKCNQLSHRFVDEYIAALCRALESYDLHCVRLFIDTHYGCTEKFTALGSLYFVHAQLLKVRIWNFVQQSWELADSSCMYFGDIECVPTKAKLKFPELLFPGYTKARKGFMRTRWKIDGTLVDLINIHLFHDASNLLACEASPSTYCVSRRRALLFIIKKCCMDDVSDMVPTLLFGDFNFRCDLKKIVMELKNYLTTHRVQSCSGNHLNIIFKTKTGDDLLIIGKKEFRYNGYCQQKLKDRLKKFDTETDAFGAFLKEFPVRFAPTYPFEERSDKYHFYMPTRCPSWCDRVLMSQKVRDILGDGGNSLHSNSSENYDIIGSKLRMGDHKPVFISFYLREKQATQIAKFEETGNHIVPELLESLRRYERAGLTGVYLCRFIKISLVQDICKKTESNNAGANNGCKWQHITKETSL